MRRHVGDARLELATEMLRAIAVANHLAQRRTFSLDDARGALRGMAAHLRLWEELLASGAIPLVKVLALGDQSGEFQFKHLSFQEACLVPMHCSRAACCMCTARALHAHCMRTRHVHTACAQCMRTACTLRAHTASYTGIGALRARAVPRRGRSFLGD